LLINDRPIELTCWIGGKVGQGKSNEGKDGNPGPGKIQRGGNVE